LFLLSPAAIVPLNEFSEWQELANLPWVAVVLNFMGYGICLFFVRQLCLLSADQLLGRVENYEATLAFENWPSHRGQVSNLPVPLTADSADRHQSRGVSFNP
jgi:hypothetical protein